MFVAASFASLSASSFPRVPTWTLTQQNLTFQSACSSFLDYSRMLSIRDVWIRVFLMESRIVWLPVYMVAIFTAMFIFCKYSSDFSIATCSDWLFVRHLLNRYCRLEVCLAAVNMATPAPTSFSFLLPPVKICMVLSSSWTIFKASEWDGWVKPVFCSRVVIELNLLFHVSFGDLKELGGVFFFNVNCSQACNDA